MVKNCPMRHENGNCIPAGGFCTANKNICEALLNAYRMGKEQLSKESTTSDLISRQAARHALCKAVHNGEDVPCENQTASCLWTGTRVCDFVREIDALPSVQPEPSIPLSWIEEYIERLKSLDNEFVNLAAAHISVMVKKWRNEQNDRTD